MKKKKQEKYFSEDDFLNCNRENREMMDLLFLRGMGGLSSGTRYQYLNALRFFFCWNLKNNGNKSIFDMKKSDWEAFDIWLMRNGFSASSINSKRVGVNRLCEFVERDFRYKSPLFRNITKGSKTNLIEKKRDIVGLITDEEISSVRRYLRANNKIRELLIFTLMIEMGLTAKEILQIKRDVVTEGINPEGKYISNRIISGNPNTTGVATYKTLVFNERIMELMRQYDRHRGSDFIDKLFIVNAGAKKSEMNLGHFQYSLKVISMPLKRIIRASQIRNTYLYNHNRLKLQEIKKQKKK